jgi:Cof subfamily protein (haloacid dehalogenase superfamily)
MHVSIKTLDKTILASREIKALAFDLDGTLLGPGAVLTERTIQAIRACSAKGIEIIFATGRAMESSEKYRIPLGAAGPMVYFNGAIVAGMPEGKILHATLLSKKITEFCLDLSREKAVYFQLYIPGTKEKPGFPLLTEKEGPVRDMYNNHTGLLAELADLKEVLRRPELEGCIKCMFLAEPEILESLRPIIEARFGKEVYVVRSTRTYLEILDPGVSKGKGLLLALHDRGISPIETIAFGDEENDLPMFEAAGFSIAPGSAKETVKAKADLVIGSNAEDGIAVFLEETFLGA